MTTDTMSQRIVCMTNESMPMYVWINITDKTAEELADELFIEAIPTPFAIERVTEIDSPHGYNRNWNADYTIENYLRDRIVQIGYEEYYPVLQTTYSAVIVVGDPHGKEVVLELLH